MRPLVAIARKEVRGALGSSWLLAYASVFALLAVALSYAGERSLGSVGLENFSRTTASLLNLSLLLAPLVALLVGSGAVAGDRDRGTLSYLLAQPVDRWQLLLGKYIGVSVSVALATTIGFGAGGVAIALMTSSMDAGTYLLFAGLVLALVVATTGIGFVASVVSKTRVQALGIAMLAWALGVFFFDLMLIGIVASMSLGGGGLLFALLFNPVEVVRVLAIIHLEPDLQVLGPFGSYLLERIGTRGAVAVLAAALVAWTAAPIALAAYLFERRSD